MKVLATTTLLVLASCATTGTPEGVFDSYIQAYADGDAKTMWALSTPGVHADTTKMRAKMLAILGHPDPAVRIQLEGTHAITKEVVQAMDTHGFYIWAVYAIRRQLGAVQIRRVVGSMTRKYVESLGPNDVNVVYRGIDGSPQRMHLRRIDGRWYIQFNPFQSPMPADKDSESTVEAQELNPVRTTDESEVEDTPKSDPTPFPWDE